MLKIDKRVRGVRWVNLEVAKTQTLRRRDTVEHTGKMIVDEEQLLSESSKSSAAATGL